MSKSSKFMVILTGVWWYLATHTFMLKEYHWTAYMLLLIAVVNLFTLLLEKYDEQQRLLKEEEAERSEYWSDR